MRTLAIVPIVEGHGDVAAVPILLHRLAAAIRARHAVNVLRPIRVPRGRLIRLGELERAVELAGRQSASGDAILVLLDADDDCPAKLAPKLLARATKVRRDRYVRVVLAKREFESWFLAAAKSIGGHCNLRPTLEVPSDPEAIRDAKGWLKQNSLPGKPYREAVDQAALARIFDLVSARRAPSFDKFFRDVDALFRKK